MDSTTKVEAIDGKYGPYVKLSRGDRWINIPRTSFIKLIESKVCLFYLYNTFSDTEICIHIPIYIIEHFFITCIFTFLFAVEP